MCVWVCVCVCACRRNSNKLTNLLCFYTTHCSQCWKSIQVLKYTDVFLPGPLLTFSFVRVSYDHTTMHTAHMHTNTAQPWSKPQMAVNHLLWAGLDESVSLDTGFLPSGRLLVYFSTHQRLDVLSLSFCSDKDQIQEIDHVKCLWIIRIWPKTGAQLDANFWFDTVTVKMKRYHKLYRSHVVANSVMPFLCP